MTKSDKTPEPKKPETQVTMNFHGSVSGVAGTVQGDQIINNRPDLSESMLEIQRLWEQFEQSYNVSLPQDKKAQVQAALVEINQNPTLRERFVSALTSGTLEAFKEIANHPAVNVIVATWEGWTNP
ncbi:MAG: hypothetical protein Fur0025_15600 [Oscillatoriaceae cyanobacterium]